MSSSAPKRKMKRLRSGAGTRHDAKASAMSSVQKLTKWWHASLKLPWLFNASVGTPGAGSSGSFRTRSISEKRPPAVRHPRRHVWLPRRIQSAVLIPNADRATIDPAKLHDYLLSATHPIGRFKARFFTALGFTPDRWEELAEALRLQHLTQDGQPADPTHKAENTRFALS